MEAFATRSHPSGDPNVGAVVRTHRAAKGLSQRALARDAEMHYSTIQKIETGDRGLGLDSFARLYGVLGIDFATGVLHEILEGLDGTG